MQSICNIVGHAFITFNTYQKLFPNKLDLLFLFLQFKKNGAEQKNSKGKFS